MMIIIMIITWMNVFIMMSLRMNMSVREVIGVSVCMIVKWKMLLIEVQAHYS